MDVLDNKSVLALDWKYIVNFIQIFMIKESGMSEWLLSNFQIYHGQIKSIDDVCFVLDQHDEMDLYRVSSLK